MALAQFAAERQAIQAAFYDAWDQDLYPVKWEGVAFDQPEGSPWVALHIIPGIGERADLGASSGPRHRFAGVVVIQIFVPEALAKSNEPSALDQAAEIVDLITPIFHEIELDTDSGGKITFRTTYTSTVGVSGGLYQVNAVTEYVRDEIL